MASLVFCRKSSLLDGGSKCARDRNIMRLNGSVKSGVCNGAALVNHPFPIHYVSIVEILRL